MRTAAIVVFVAVACCGLVFLAVARLGTTSAQDLAKEFGKKIENALDRASVSARPSGPRQIELVKQALPEYKFVAAETEDPNRYGSTEFHLVSLESEQNILLERNVRGEVVYDIKGLVREVVVTSVQSGMMGTRRDVLWLRRYGPEGRASDKVKVEAK